MTGVEWYHTVIILVSGLWFSSLYWNLTSTYVVCGGGGGGGGGSSSSVDQLDAGPRPHVQSIVQLTVILTNPPHARDDIS